MRTTRRSFLTVTGSGLVLAACAHGSASAREHGHEDHADDHDEEVMPAEDLMREHGILRRVTFLYQEAVDRFAAKREVPLDALAAGAALIRRVIEDYHEKLEEQHLFPRFEAAGKLADLCAVLRRQHEAGRAMTAQVIALAKAPLADADRAKLVTVLRGFDRMYQAHAAREDTVLFPAIRGLVGGKAYAELGEQFEELETTLIGEGGFEHAVAEVAKLEAAFGVADLASLG